jgi:hypothetical protein
MHVLDRQDAYVEGLLMQHRTPRKIYPPRECDVCGNTFIPRRKTTLRCSPACQAKHIRDYIKTYNHNKIPIKAPILCRVCGKEFTPRSTTQKSCSKECQKTWEKKYLTNYLMNRYKTDPEFKRKWIQRCINYNNRIAAENKITKYCEICKKKLEGRQMRYCVRCANKKYDKSKRTAQKITSTIDKLNETLRTQAKIQKKLVKLLKEGRI